jgi:transposase
MKRLYVGGDIGKRNIEAAVWETGATRGNVIGQLANERAGYEWLVGEVERLRRASGAAVVQLVVEPTGGYELGLVAFAQEQGWLVSLPNPKVVRDYGKGIGQRAKTDRQDALLLARYGAERQPAVQVALPAAIEQLESLLQRREELEKLLQAERNRLDNLRHRPRPVVVVTDSVQRVIDKLEEELAAMEQAIESLLQQQPELKQQAKRLLTVPGIGHKTVLPLLVFLHRWDCRTNGQGTAKGLTAYAGLDARPFESGSSVYHRPTISKMGDGSIRAALYMASLGGIRGHNPLRTFYQGLVSRGKAKRLALVAASRKILTWAWAVFKQATTFDPTRASAHLAFAS